MLVTLPTTVIKYLIEATLRKEDISGIMFKKGWSTLWWQDCQVTGHIAFTVGNRYKCWCSFCLLLFPFMLNSET